MNQNKIKFSDTSSITINIIRILSIQFIAISHGLENINAIGLSNIIGVSSFNLLMMMSGLLISFSIIRRIDNEDFDFKAYLTKRFSRIYISVLTIYTIIIFVDWVNNYNFLHNITTFIFNILLLNDSALGYEFYGYNRHLWAIPLFWWQYLFFGWLLLGHRTTKKRYIYYIVLGFFAFILGLIFFGTRTEMKGYYTVIWYFGANFTFLIYKLQNYLKRKSIENNIKNEHKESQLKRKIKFLSLFVALIFFILALIRSTTFKKFHDTYNFIYNVCFALSFMFFLLFLQYVKVKIPKKIKKTVSFFASYSFTFFLFHMCLYNLILKPEDDLVLFIFVHIIGNLISILIAYFTEMRYNEFYKYLMKKFNLYKESTKKRTISQRNILK